MSPVEAANVNYRVYDIDYDTDGEEVDLPAELEVELEQGADPSLELADEISDRTGFCVRAFKFDEVPAPGPTP